MSCLTVPVGKEKVLTADVFCFVFFSCLRHEESVLYKSSPSGRQRVHLLCLSFCWAVDAMPPAAEPSFGGLSNDNWQFNFED